MPAHTQGDVLLAWLVFSGGQGTKRRPVLLVQDFGDDDLLVLPVTSHPARVAAEVRVAGRAGGRSFTTNIPVEKNLAGALDEAAHFTRDQLAR